MSMGMSMALEYCQDWFRKKNGWKANECGVQYEYKPALDAGNFYIAIDDAGIEVGNELTDSIKEILRINVAIWMRPEHLAIKDLRGTLKITNDPYLIRSFMLTDYYQRVMLPSWNGLHANYLFMQALNAYFSLANSEMGVQFNRPLFYKGRGRIETLGIADDNSTSAWFGYVLTFRGLDREQNLRSGAQG